MRESISYTATLNLIIVFVVIFFFFLSGTLIYFKTNKSGKFITDSIEKYEGYNKLSETAIYQRMTDIGYSMRSINCSNSVKAAKDSTAACNLVKKGTYETSHSEGDRGYCVYYCDEGDYYYYKVSTNGVMNLPLINEILNIPVISTTNRMYDYENKLK